MEQIDPQLVELVDAAAGSAESWFDLAQALREMQQKRDETRFAPFISAFSYDLVRWEQSDRREQFGPLAPAIELANATYPPPLAEAPSEWFDQWEALVRASRSPAVRSRLNDLLWIQRVSTEPHSRARDAIDDYLTQTDTWSDIQAVDCLTRALELSREINDRAAQTNVVNAIVAHAHKALEDEEWKPGVPLGFISTLLELPRSDQPDEIDALIAISRKRYGDDPWLTQNLIEFEIARNRANESRVQELRREEVSQWRRFADSNSGFLRFSHLQHALELARVHGVSDQAQEIRRELQDFDQSELEFSKITASVEIPNEARENLIEDIVGASWQEGLTRLGARGPFTGNFEDNKTTVKELMQRFPLQFLLPKVILGPENTVTKTLSTEEARFQAELVAHESTQLRFWADIAQEALERIRERHEHADAEALTTFFTTEIVSADIAEAFSRSLLLFWGGMYDEAAHLLVPRLEATIREVARRIGLVIIREPVGVSPGRVKTLGELLANLHGRFDESWRRYLCTLLTEPLGLNLRNRVAHGLVIQIDALGAALLIQAACFLRLLSVQSPGASLSTGPSA